MMIKLAIIGGVLLVGGILFSNEINQIFYESSLNFFDSPKNELGKISDDTSRITDSGISRVVETVINDIFSQS